MRNFKAYLEFKYIRKDREVAEITYRVATSLFQELQHQLLDSIFIAVQYQFTLDSTLGKSFAFSNVSITLQDR